VSGPKLPEQSLELISHNFQNIYAAAHSNQEIIHLVPSLWGNKLYCPSAGWRGRILRLIYFFANVLVGSAFFEKKLNAAIKATHAIYQELEKFRYRLLDSTYQEYLNARFANSKNHAALPVVNNAREQIQLFYQATYPLIELVRSEKSRKLNTFLHAHFPEIYDKKDKPFYDKTSFKSLRKHVKIMALEGMTAGELPFHIFQKVICKEPIQQSSQVADKEQKSLLKFIKRIHQAKEQGKFEIELFHEGMKSLILSLPHYRKENIGADLVSLEKTLIKEGCFLLEKFDLKHLQWREGLQQGCKLIKANQPFYFRDKKNQEHLFELGDSLKGHETTQLPNLYKVFEIFKPHTSQKYEKVLFVVGPNKLCFEYSKLLRSEEFFWALATPQFKYIDPKGRYAIIEKLPTSLESIAWHTHKKSKLSKMNRAYAEPLRLLIRFFVEEKNTPRYLNVEYFKFDGKGRLKSTKDCIPSGYLDSIGLEEIIFIAAQGNLPVYQHIIEPLLQASQNRKVLIFFRQSIRTIFSKCPVPIESLARKYGLKNKRVKTRARELQQKALSLKEDCYQAVYHHFEHEGIDKSSLLKSIKKSLLALYKNHRTFGRLWPIVTSTLLIETVELDPQKFCEKNCS
jgi:hypothetical protein